MNEEVKILTKQEVMTHIELFFHPRNIALYGEDSIYNAIGRVLSNNAFMISCTLDDRLLGVVACAITGSDRRTLEFLQLYAKNGIKASIDMFLTWAKAQGFVAICGITHANPLALSKILGAEVKYSYLERRL